eukprot:Tbor_TRINITY_DN5294_c2_g1::TRINITY_DN5294_c2_g1_i2::g.16009::m.16009
MSTVPGASRYNRIPTRQKLQLFWIGVGLAGAGYEFVKFTTLRVHPRKEELLYKAVTDKYGNKDLPEEMMTPLLRVKEAQETLTLQNMLDTPTPGELCGALQNELDPRAIARLRSRNGN